MFTEFVAEPNRASSGMMVLPAWRNPSRFTVKRFRPVVGEWSQQRGNDRLSGRSGSRFPASRIGRQANIRSSASGARPGGVSRSTGHGREAVCVGLWKRSSIVGLGVPCDAERAAEQGTRFNSCGAAQGRNDSRSTALLPNDLVVDKQMTAG